MLLIKPAPIIYIQALLTFTVITVTSTREETAHKSGGLKFVCMATLLLLGEIDVYTNRNVENHFTVGTVVEY